MDGLDEQTIPEYFAGKNIFITGATGFMGKVLVEKIIRSCPDVNAVYVLIRSKRGKTAKERWDEKICEPLFDKVKKINNGKLLEKIKVIEGDIYAKDLGLTIEDKKELIDNVHFVYHGAAAVQFTEDLVYSFRQNTLGTFNVADLAKSIKNLKCFIYVSTAYSNCNRLDSTVLEEVLPTELDWKLLKELDTKEFYALSVLRPKLMCGHPTTYTLTKGLAEQVMKAYSEFYPVIIIRPSLVLATNDDPIEGWVDMLNGLSSIIVSVGFGLLRVILTNENSSLDFISVDHAVKAFLVSTWLMGKRNLKSGIEVMSCNYGKGLKLTSREITEECFKFSEEYPFEGMIWYPTVALIHNKILFSLYFFLIQISLAVFGDLMLAIAGKKRRIISLTIKMAQAFYGPIKFFATQNFSFPNAKFKKLPDLVLEKDKSEFAFDISKLRKSDVIQNNSLGTYKYYLKQRIDKESLTKKKVIYQRFKMAHYTMCTFVGFFILYLIFKVFNIL